MSCSPVDALSAYRYPVEAFGPSDPKNTSPLLSALGGSPLAWQVYDDTYYIEFLYDQDTDTPIALQDAPADCTGRVIPADPDPQRVADAAALDRDATAPSGLGRFFAETGELTCPAP